MSFLDGDLLKIRRPLKQYCVKLTGNVDDAEDLSGDVIVKALRYRDRFQGSLDDLKRWILVIARNEFYSKMRRRKFVGDMDYIDQDLDLVAPDNAIHKLDLDDALKAMVFLDPIRKSVISLLAQGYSLEEVAEELDMNVGTVKSAAHRARQFLLLYLG